MTGDKEINRKLKKLGDPKRTNQIMRSAMRRSLKPIAAAARALTPKDTGTMAAAYVVNAGKRSRKSITFVVRLSAKKIPEKTSKDGVKGWYPATVEYGSESQGREPAAPMRTAYDNGAESARDSCLKEVRDEVMKL